MMRLNQFAIATLATLLIANSLVAQQSQPPTTQDRQTEKNKSQATDGDSQTKDQTFATCLAIANQEQVLISRFAKDKATSADVKEFAATLAKAHQNSLQQLKELSPENEAIGNASSPSSSQVGKQTSTVDFLQLHQEISTQCLEDSKEMLSSKDGIEFDKCFVGMQIAKHAAMHSNLTVLQRHATGKLQELIKSELETIAKHKEAAVNLMDKLAENDSPKVARQSK